ncbi:MAG: Two-component transcriptional response regulator, LuxR family [uncultured Blastococcus sp.]|uniref:Two-component transcriptional response regulator, LuxR family n=1 Tax=uncultured Blastococcus sp. TaxID=217144 RepID=A0A6J4J4W3_9ACTN|nr:MAG: Two-component transcriptional response regulator, LuxR family [uncultured Blastococcus sp.]
MQGFASKSAEPAHIASVVAALHGGPVAEIAGRLHLAHGTVRNYLSSAMQKTQTHTRHEAARYAREHGWL